MRSQKLVLLLGLCLFILGYTFGSLMCPNTALQSTEPAPRLLKPPSLPPTAKPESVFQRNAEVTHPRRIAAPKPTHGKPKQESLSITGFSSCTRDLSDEFVAQLGVFPLNVAMLSPIDGLQQRQSIVTEALHPARRNMKLACYRDGDLVCSAVSKKGQWETWLMETLALSLFLAGRTGKPLYLDIGGNVGGVAFPVAAYGFETHIFEMLPSNQNLLALSRCINDISEHEFKIYPVGLGAKSETCKMASERGNQGDGMMLCGNDTDSKLRNGFAIRGTVKIERLDDLAASYVVPEMTAGRPVVVKMDVEGQELNVLAGGMTVFGHRNPPMVVIAEVWAELNVEDFCRKFLPLNYVGFGYHRRSWITDGESCAAYQSKHIEVDSIAWIQRSFAPLFAKASKETREKGVLPFHTK